MNRSFSLTVGCILIVSLLGARASAQNMVVQQVGSRTELSLEGGQPFHTTEAQVTGARFIGVSGSTLLVGLWNETAGAGEIVPHYAVSLAGKGVRKNCLMSSGASVGSADGMPRECHIVRALSITL